MRRRRRHTSSGSSEGVLRWAAEAEAGAGMAVTGNSVQLGSKYVTSRVPLRWGLNGGSISFLMIFFQSTEAKKGCAVTAYD